MNLGTELSTLSMGQSIGYIRRERRFSNRWNFLPHHDSYGAPTVVPDVLENHVDEVVETCKHKLSHYQHWFIPLTIISPSPSILECSSIT